MDIISRKEARTQSLKRYFTGKPCKRGHLSERRVSNHSCIECDEKHYKDNFENIRDKRHKYREQHIDKYLEMERRYRIKGRDIRLEYAHQYYINNSETIKERSRLYRENNSEQVSEWQRDYRERNPEQCAAKGKKWREGNPDKHRASRAKRRAAKLERTPKWLTKQDHKDNQFVFWVARMAMDYTNDEHKYEVDHEIPLQGELVSGLHVPGNLRIMPAAENNSKSNKFNPWAFEVAKP